jgi:hypothetical protein
MKVFVFTLALASLASTATLDAQILGGRPVPTTNASVNVDGSWRVVGRDGNGNTIYERRTQDRNGNILVQRARRDANGNMSIISTNTVRNTGNIGNIGTSVDGSWRVVGRDGSGNTIYERRTTDRNGNVIVQRARRDANGNMSIISSNTVGNVGNNSNCNYTQSTNTVGDIIFGRNGNNVNCDDNGNRVDGGWYQVGQGRDNNSIYERRIRDANGNLVIQRARRNSNGTFTILNSRRYNDNDKQWRKAQQRQEKEMRKEQKQQDKQGRSERDDDNGNNASITRGDRSYVAGSAVEKGSGHGKGNGKSNGKGKHND